MSEHHQIPSSLTGRILVAGGTGFLGRHITSALEARGCDVVAVGRDGMAQAMRSRYNAVVWAAGGRSMSKEEMEEQHVVGPGRIFECLEPDAQLVYLSTAQVYGVGSCPFVEGAETLSTTPYSLAKLRGEARLTELAQAHGVSLRILRIAIAYGEGQGGGMFIPLLLRHLRDRIPFETSPGAQTRDFIHAEDVATAVCCALRPDAPAGIFNVGTGIETPIRELALHVVREFDRHWGTSSEDLLLFGGLPYRENEQMRYVVDMAKATAELGFKPQIELVQGIRRVVTDLSPSAKP